MNRRGFFQRIAGFSCGILGIKALPEKRSGTKEVLTVDKIREIRDRLAEEESKEKYIIGQTSSTFDDSNSHFLGYCAYWDFDGNRPKFIPYMIDGEKIV